MLHLTSIFFSSLEEKDWQISILMQSFSSSYVRQPFAITKCCHPKEKKPRQRRSKEERKMMVESFINKYRDAHNGEFPSLNLAHKEVGGSFYTVREIVREIIQENKVLGPGSLSLKSLDFQDYMEEEQKKLNTDYELSLSSFGPATDCMKPKVVEVSSEHATGNLQQIESLVHQGLLLSPQNDSSISQPIQSVHSDLLRLNNDDLNQHLTLVSVDSVEEKLQEPITQSHCSKTYESLNPESHGTFSSSSSDMDKVGQLYLVQQSLFINAPEKEVAVDEDAINNSRLAVETDSADVEKSGASKRLVEDSLPEDEMSSSLVGNVSGQSLCSSIDSEKYVSPFENIATEMSSCESDFKRDNFDSSQQALGSQSSENQVIVSSSPNHEISMVNRIENSAVFSSDVVDEGINHSVSPLSQSISSPFGPSTSEADLATAINGRAYVSSDSQGQGLQDISQAELEEKKVPSDRKMEIGSSSRSHLCPENESRTAESSPFWDAIKAVLSAVVKFWTE